MADWSAPIGMERITSILLVAPVTCASHLSLQAFYATYARKRLNELSGQALKTMTSCL